MELDPDKRFMHEAFKMAVKAFEADEVPVGAVIVHKNAILAKAHNQIEALKDPSAHAEMIAITAAANALGQKWLHQCTMYVTLEPCAMCTGAMVLARIERLVFGARDPKTGACGSVMNLAQHDALNHKFVVNAGVMEEQCAQLLSEFFKAKRNRDN
jgi:tRNA(adenine34) deaminase